MGKMIPAVFRFSRFFHLAKMPLLVGTFLVFSMATGQAEVRTYFRATTGICHSSHHYALHFFLQQEDRFKESGLVLNKVSVGVQPMIYSWFSMRFYYANKDMNYSRHVNKHLLAGDIILSTAIGVLTIKSRIEHEWHITDHFYRYRNYIELSIRTPIDRLSAWSSEEWRYDSDEAQINLNDIRVGILVKVKEHLAVKTFLDFESDRRNRDSWHTHPFLGLRVAMKV